MKRFKLIVPLLLILILVACAGVQERWNTLTPDEKARVIINDLQSQLNTLFDTGKAYVVANPKYQEKWKKEIIPAFSVANKAIASALVLAQSGEITPDQVYAQIQPLLNSIVILLTSIGMNGGN